MTQLPSAKTLSILAEWVTAPLTGDNRTQDEWIRLLARIPELPRPDSHLTIYRGTCRDEYSYEWWGMSWTTSRDVARMYCDYHRHFHGGDCDSAPTILSAVVQPDAVLADLRPYGNADSEIVVNPQLLGHVTVSESAAATA